MSDGTRLVTDLDKIRSNAAKIVAKCRDKGIEVLGVTKGFNAMPEIVSALLEGGIQGLADSRMENIIDLRNQGFTESMTLLRIPQLSDVENVVKYSDVSVNSEIAVIQALAEAARSLHKVHKIILMVDVGDLREGIMSENVMEMMRRIAGLEGIRFIGLGTNMGCFGGILPSPENLGLLARIAEVVEDRLDIPIEVLSGGGTSTLLLVEEDKIPRRINQVRIGEGILLGTDTTNNRKIPWLDHDAFLLEAEVIEVKAKPSVPIGEIGRDAFGNTPQFIDEGIRNRAILALGKQDVVIEGIIPVDETISILGASSDHLIVDITNSSRKIEVGDVVGFQVTYPGLLSASQSRYIKKIFKGRTL